MAFRPNAKGNYVFSVFVSLVVTVLLSVQGYAQVPGATLTGSVSDASGAVIPDAQISTKNVAAAVARNLAADTSGFHYENGRLVEVRLYPGDLGQDQSRSLSRRGIPMIPSPEMAKRVLEKVQRLSLPFGTKMAIENGVGVIRVPHQESEAPGPQAE